MTAKIIATTVLEQETVYQGATDADRRVLALQEPIDVSSLIREVIEDTTQRASIWDGGDGPTLGLRAGELSLPVDLSGRAANDGGAVTDDSDGKVIAAAIGTSAGATGSTVEASPAPTTKVFTVVSAAGLAATKMVLVDCGANGHRAAAIREIDGAEVTLDTPLPAAPGTAAAVYGGVTYTPSETRTTYNVKIHQDNDALGWEVKGVHFVPEFSQLGAGEGKARLTLKGTIGDWANMASTLASQGPPDTFTRPGVVQDEGWFVLTDGTDAISCIVSSVQMSNLLTQMRRKDACKANCVGTPEVMPSMDKSLVAELWQPTGATADPIAQLRTWFAAGTKLKLLYQIGEQPADCIAFYFPAVVISQEPVPSDKDGLVAIPAAFKITIDRADTVFTRPWYFARF
jgi:hypothetical protein